MRPIRTPFIGTPDAAGEISLTLLTSGSDSTNNPSTTASISPSSGSVVLAFFGYAVETYGNGANGLPEFDVSSISVSGCGLTWTSLGWFGFGYRRGLHVFKGTGTPSSGTLTLSVSFTDSTWTENVWGVVEVTGADSTTPFGTFYKSTSVANNDDTNSVTVSDTPDTGDYVIYAVGRETAVADQFITLNGELDTKLLELVRTADPAEPTDYRNLDIAYDSAPDSTPVPGCSWYTNCYANGCAFVINVGTGGGGLDIPIAMHHHKQIMR